MGAEQQGGDGLEHGVPFPDVLASIRKILKESPDGDAGPPPPTEQAH